MVGKVDVLVVVWSTIRSGTSSMFLLDSSPPQKYKTLMFACSMTRPTAIKLRRDCHPNNAQSPSEFKVQFCLANTSMNANNSDRTS